MRREPMREVFVHATFNDAYDGIIRLLGDAQRFGFEIRALTLATEVQGVASATFMLTVPLGIDDQLVEARLARHPGIRSLDARRADRQISDKRLTGISEWHPRRDAAACPDCA